MFLTLGLPLGAYLIGSIPWGLILTRLFTDIDIRRHGSGNIGATNVRRLAGTPLGLATLVGDVAKGAVPTYLAGALAPASPLPLAGFVSLVALAAFLGHLFPLYTGLREGGKGVATAAGAIAVISPLSVGIALAAFILAVAVSRRVSVGSLAAAVCLPFLTGGLTHSGVYGACAAVMAVFIIYRHKSNIRRLRDGTEPGFKNRPQ
jgi:glycerol-3-phosphate acyltransferase PlsY